MAKLSIAYSPWRRAPGLMIGLPCRLRYNRITGRIYRQCERARAPAAACPRALNMCLSSYSQRRQASSLVDQQWCWSLRDPRG
jgi:hypothetical protein